MNEAIEKLIESFLSQADTALGRGYAAVLYGSAARGDYIAGHSDVNLLLLLDDASPERLRALAGALKQWTGARQAPPLLMSRAEWARVTDAFPIEIADMQSAYRVLRGADPLAGITVDRADLRRALERELRGKLLRLRQAYAGYAGDTKALATLARGSVATILLMLRSLLRLLGRPAPNSARELIPPAAAVVGFPATALAVVAEHRGDTRWRCDVETFAAYLGAVERAVRYVDELQLGDQ